MPRNFPPNITVDILADLIYKRFPEKQKAWKKIRSQFSYFEQLGYLRYVKVLGHGGYGLVQLWTVHRPETGALERPIAIKALINPRMPANIEAQRNEIAWTKMFTGCEHMIQLVDLDPAVMPNYDINRSYTPSFVSPDRQNPLMIMEYSGLGSLKQVLQQVHQAKWINTNRRPLEEPRMEYIPTRILWSLFLCMVRGCIAMAWPPENPEQNMGSRICEQVPHPGENRKPRKIVHFDIDVLNIFLSEPTPEYTRNIEHNACPVAKIADYGLMREWDDRWRDQKKLQYRAGKTLYMPPEVRIPELTLLPGALDAHSNVYQIGAAMQELILILPVEATDLTLQERTIQFGDNPPRSVVTYGWRLIGTDFLPIQPNYDNVDLTLRTLIVGCMAHDPAERPTLDVLQDTCFRRIADLEDEARWDAEELRRNGVPAGAYDYVHTQVRVPKGTTEPMALTKKFENDYFWNPPQEPDRYGDYWDMPLLPNLPVLGGHLHHRRR